MGNLTRKHVAGSLRGAAATIAVPDAMRLGAWGDVMGRGDSDSGLSLDESDFNLVDKYKTF